MCLTSACISMACKQKAAHLTMDWKACGWQSHICSPALASCHDLTYPMSLCPKLASHVPGHMCKSAQQVQSVPWRLGAIGSIHKAAHSIDLDRLMHDKASSFFQDHKRGRSLVCVCGVRGGVWIPCFLKPLLTDRMKQQSTDMNFAQGGFISNVCLLATITLVLGFGKHV